MHLIDTVMASVSLFDTVKAEESGEISVLCDYALSGKNIALTAAERVYELTKRKLNIEIRKGIPIGGGMGGSSADAAAVLFVADKLFGLSGLTNINALALSLGADVPYMLAGGFCRAKGFGEEIESFTAPPGMKLLIAECGGVSTAECYKLSDTLDNPAADIGGVIAGLKSGKLSGLSNALLPAARLLNPRITEAEKIFNTLGAECYLTGSGGCVFGVYDGKIKAALNSAGFKTHEAYTFGKGITQITMYK